MTLARTILLASRSSIAPALNSTVAALSSVSRPQQLVRRKIGNDEAVTAGEIRCGLGDILAIAELDLAQREVLIEEFPGVLLSSIAKRAPRCHRFSAGCSQETVLPEAGVTEITDSDFHRIGREAWLATMLKPIAAANDRIMVPP